ncbi:hypothetical protein D9758_008455 [Tetrapyrgos nigripes]|uniref:Uncharacterized protein n=1 Tax=Tetrapyrgos nigripes TaxID=182062 RepID=A0A8H5CPL6_9AGAR|nr:hypothetical protein D9758_008455 [Tetrapyrgos nigripes]
MGRWDQYEQDDFRLPDGFQRIGYDGDTQESVFQDREGNIYRSSPGVPYGPLRQVSKPHQRNESSESNSNPFDDPPPYTPNPPTPPERLTLNVEPLPARFEDLPQHQFQPDPSAGDRFVEAVEAVKKSAVPKLQGVVKNLRETVKSHSRNSSRNEK